MRLVAARTVHDTTIHVLCCTRPCCLFLTLLLCILANPASGHADNVWWSTGEHTPHSWRHHPHPDAPRCIPCHYDDSSYVASPEATIPSYKAIKGCPCTPELLCAHNNHSDHMSEDWFNKYCDMPRLPHHMYSMHGGAGALMSIGLMRKVGWDFVEPCVLRTFSTGAFPIIQLLLLLLLPKRCSAFAYKSSQALQKPWICMLRALVWAPHVCCSCKACWWYYLPQAVGFECYPAVSYPYQCALLCLVHQNQQQLMQSE